MKYMVMECHLTYAVVLSEDGRFLKAANLHYEPGQVVTDLVEMEIPESRRDEKRKGRRWIYTLAAAAACLMLAATSMFQAGNRTYGSVYMTINPEVRIDVNRKDLVVDLEGINQDGLELIDGYSYRKKELDVVVDELVDRAIDQGYLHEGGRISLALEGEDGQWVMDQSDSLSTHLNEHLTGKMSVTIEVTDRNHESSQVMIPITPQADHYNEMDYGEDKETPGRTITMKWIMGKIKKRLRKRSQFRRSQYCRRRLQRRIRKPASRRRAAGRKASRRSRRRQKQSQLQQSQCRQDRLPSRRRSRPPHCLKPGLLMTTVRRTMKIPTMARRIMATGTTVRPIMEIWTTARPTTGTMMTMTMGMMIKKFFSHPVFPDTLPYSFNVKQIRGPLSPKKFLM